MLDQMQVFTDHMAVEFPDVTRVEFGKQDIRGNFTICMFNNDGMEPTGHIEWFKAGEMFEYIKGFNRAKISRGWL